MTPRHDPLHPTTAAVTVAVWARLSSDVILSRFAAHTPHVTNHTPQCTKLQFYSATLNRIRPSTSLDSPLKTSAKVPSLCHHFVYVVAVMFYLFFHIAHDKSHITRHNPLAAPLSQPHCSVQTGFTVAWIVLRLPNQR